MRQKVRLLTLCIVILASMVLCSACGQAYELVIADSAAKSSGGTAGVSVAEPADAAQGPEETAADPKRSDGDLRMAGDSKTAGDSQTAGEDSGETAAVQREEICVYVCGAVRDAGVYTLPAGSRVYEAVEAAGGLTEDAEPRALNQAQLLEDGQQITVYTREEAEGIRPDAAVEEYGTGGAGGGSAGTETDKVNLNTAGKDELMTLSGIGEARAEAVLAYRQAHGGFSSTEDLMQIDGIGEKLYGKLKDRVTV